ncbi:MAG: carboxypeptidase-like regulatory domain-containing protein [Bacteroidota bacterium]
MSGKNKHRSANDYLNYLKGQLSRQERHAFERGLEADPFEQEAMEGFESLSAGQAEEDLLSLHNRLRKRVSRRRRVAFYSVAATVASLLIVGTVFLKIHDFDPRSDKNQVYPEESYENFVPEEAESLPPVDKQVEKSAPVPEPVPDPAELKEETKSEKKTESRAEGEFPSGAKGETRVHADQEVEADAVEVLDFAAPVPEAGEIQKEEIQEEEITYMEAEAMDRVDEAQAARTSREFRKSKKAQGEILADQKYEAPKTVVNQLELEQMLTGKVTGIVISAEDQDPIPGVVVVNRELPSGVYTDLEGRFGISVKEDSHTTLIASFIGMETQEYLVEDGAHVELVMQPDAATLDEVVVVGYVAEREDQPTGSAFTLYQAEEEENIEYEVPEPSIGFKNYRKYIEENIRHPQEADSKKEVVVLQFTVTQAGTIEDVTALRSPGLSFTEEAVRLLMEGPPWKPASNDKGARDESVRIRIVFKR